MIGSDTRPRLLVVDDDRAVAAILAETGEKAGMRAAVVHSYAEFRRTYATAEPDVIALDLVMPDADGVEVLNFLNESGCSAEILLVSGSDTRTMDSIRRLGNSMDLKTRAWLQKPVEPAELEAEFRKAAAACRPVIEEELVNGMSDGGIIPYFQPKVSLTDGSICGFEALVRWQHPTRGLLLPGSIVPLAEQGNLILDMTDAVFKDVVDHSKSWIDAGFSVPVSVNLSVDCLRDPSLPDRFAHHADAHGVDRTLLTFEVTENQNFDSLASAASVLTRLRLKGFGLSMDDYGTGFSTLVQLVRLPFGELKIDRAFVSEIGERNEARIIVESTAAMAHSMGLSVCAEGVETHDALELVRRTGCDSVQGFLVAKPMPAERVLPFLSCWSSGRLDAA
jgi:EAL domain-containing protein (putative c-di-GMP-specific phosphodiesterase class I)